MAMTSVQHFLTTHARPVFTVGGGDTLSDTAKRFAEKTGGRKYSLAVVCDEEGKAVGVIGLGDIVYAFGQHRGAAADFLVRDVMTATIIAADPSDDVRDLLRVMAENDIRHMPVLADGKLLGLVARRDALEFLYDMDELELEQLRGYVFRSGARY